jgi:organic radical activating enzyme
MKKSEVLHAWARILAGRAPSLSIEVTKECPLQRPGCYAFDAAHLGGATQLRQLSDFKGDDLVARVLALIDEHRPPHVSLVGGDPMVRYRELELLLPQIEARAVHTQVVTSAFRVIPASWMKLKKLNVVVSVDGLQPEHDARRKPVTYERILKNIKGARVTIHCTITSQIAERPDYLGEFLTFWSRQPEVAKIWFSIFTPQAWRHRPRDTDCFAKGFYDLRSTTIAAKIPRSGYARSRHSGDRVPTYILLLFFSLLRISWISFSRW